MALSARTRTTILELFSSSWVFLLWTFNHPYKENPMKKMLIATAVIALSATSVFAQETKPAANPDGDTPAVATPSEQNATAPVEGANSFTEGQVKDRIVEAGYADVTDLKLDDKGVWQAKATKEGKSVMVSLDYQGNIVAK
jgi:hypothetical protein